MAAGLSVSEEFIALFNNLREAAGNSPERVSVFYRDSKAIRDALHALHDFLVRTDLERRVFHDRKLVILRAAGFETAWKEYDARWRFRVIWPEFNIDEIDLDAILLPAQPDLPKARRERIGERVEPEPPAMEGEPENPDPEVEDSLDPRRHDGAAALELGLQQLEFYGQSALSKPDENSCRIGLGAFDYLTGSIGLDIQSVFRRWQKLPVIFMPAHVSNHYGASEKGSLLHLIDDAVQAYVFGAPAAALAMCRATFEMILKQHYGAGDWENPKKKLSEVVALADKRGFIKREEIKPFIDRADGILHRYGQEAVLSAEDDHTILLFLATLKSLVERAPKS